MRLRVPYVALVSDSRWQLFCLFRLNVPCSFTVTWLRIPGTVLLAVRGKDVKSEKIKVKPWFCDKDLSSVNLFSKTDEFIKMRKLFSKTNGLIKIMNLLNKTCDFIKMINLRDKSIWFYKTG